MTGTFTHTDDITGNEVTGYTSHHQVTGSTNTDVESSTNTGTDSYADSADDGNSYTTGGTDTFTGGSTTDKEYDLLPGNYYFSGVSDNSEDTGTGTLAGTSTGRSHTADNTTVGSAGSHSNRIHDSGVRVWWYTENYVSGDYFAP